MTYDSMYLCRQLVFKSPYPLRFLLFCLANYEMGFTGASAHTTFMLRLTYCNVNVINHYLFDILPLLQLSCYSTCVNEVIVIRGMGIHITVPTLTILISYVFILANISNFNPHKGDQKPSVPVALILSPCIFFGGVQHSII